VEENLLPVKMKASIFETYGGPEVLHYTDVPVPQPRRGEALVKVHAVGLNGYDLMARAGRYKPNKGKFPHILGGDFGGELVALGPETSCDFALGTRVTSWWILPCKRCEQCMAGHHNRCARDYRYLGAHEHGAYAEYVRLPADHLIALPPNVSYEAAAAFPNAFGTAWHMLIDRGPFAGGRDRADQFGELGRQHGGDPDLQARRRLRLYDIERRLEAGKGQGTPRRRGHQLQRS
jgi:NADPH:quinone reductase-like Zn-dependent oxidoreductase